MDVCAPRLRRTAGLLIPLFSCASTDGWGIGEFADLPMLGGWMRGAGLRVLQLLPLNEMAPGQSSPYSALTSMALDPIYIRVPDVPDAQPILAAGLDSGWAARVDAVRQAPSVQYREIRQIKDHVLALAYARFCETERRRGTARAQAFAGFCHDEAWWLDDYARFRATHELANGASWLDWPDALSTRVPEDAVMYRRYLQWLAHDQWAHARQVAGIGVFGDFPFMVATDSADAWAGRHQFDFSGTVGAPPDAFSAEGQNWGLPIYRWDTIRASGYDWFARRARRMAALFDGFRVDHVVGLFRTWVFPADGSPSHFRPGEEWQQREQGRRVLEAILSSGATVLAEDLGTIPDFVRDTLTELGVPGYRVLRWERQWKEAGHPFVDPASYPPMSLATTGTHDTETSIEWWQTASLDERAGVLALPSAEDTVRRLHVGVETPFVPQVRDLLLEMLFASRSDLIVLPIQDVFGWADRINVPARVDDRNWTWKIPGGLERFVTTDQAMTRQGELLAWGRVFGRV